MLSVGYGASRSRWRLGNGGRTLPTLESYKVPVGVAGSFYVRLEAWTKSGEKPSPDPSVDARHPRGAAAFGGSDAGAAGRGGAGGPGVTPDARNVMDGSFCLCGRLWQNLWQTGVKFGVPQ